MGTLTTYFLLAIGSVFGFWAAIPKGTKSCGTQGDFHSFVRSSTRPYPHLNPLQSALSGLKSVLSGLKSTLLGLKLNGRMDKRKSLCVLQDFVPFAAAAQKIDEK